MSNTNNNNDTMQFDEFENIVNCQLTQLNSISSDKNSQEQQTNLPQLITALITPYDNEGKIDYSSIDKLLSKQAGNANGIVINGTTQEYTLLTDSERKELLKYVINKADDSLTKIVGVGTMDTATTVKNAVTAQSLGADALLVVTPYYSKATQTGLIAHYKAISKATTLPIIVYNVPQRTGYDLDEYTLSKLLTIDNVVGLKQCSLDYKTSTFVSNTLPHIKLYGGNDSDWINYRTIGKCGLISVLSNIVPKLAKGCVKGDSFSLLLFTQLASLCAKEVSPVAVKYLAYKLGLIATPTMRLPLTMPTLEMQLQLDNFINRYGEELV